MKTKLIEELKESIKKSFLKIKIQLLIKKYKKLNIAIEALYNKYEFNHIPNYILKFQIKQYLNMVLEAYIQ